MTTSSLRALPMGVLTVLVLGVLMSHADIAYRLRGVMPVGSTKLFLGALTCLTIGTLVRSVLSPRLRARIVGLYKAHVSVIVPLLGIVCFTFISAFVPTANWREGATYALLPVHDTLTVLLSMLLVLERKRLGFVRVSLIVAFVLLLGSIAVDVMRPGTFSVITFRAGGFPVNPNGGAFVLIVLACTIVRFDHFRWFDLGVMLLTALGVLATLSRGGVLLFAFLLLGYVGAIVLRSRGGAVRRVGRLVSIAAACVVAAFAMSAIMQRGTLFSLDSDRLEIFRGREEALTGQDLRFKALATWWGYVEQAPIIGHGSGFTMDDLGGTREGPHNIYLQQWVNSGIGGLVCYVWLLIAATRLFWIRRYMPGLMFMGLMFIEGVVSHNLFDERVFLLPLGIMLTLSYQAATAPVVARPRERVLQPPLSSLSLRMSLKAGQREHYRPT